MALTPTAGGQDTIMADTDQFDPDELLTLDEWIEEFEANACCPDRWTAARMLCGCGGSAELPSGVSRLIREAFEPQY